MVSAIATVSGPTLPRNIVREINILEKVKQEKPLHLLFDVRDTSVNFAGSSSGEAKAARNELNLQEST